MNIPSLSPALHAALVLAALPLAQAAAAAPLPRSTPESQGISTAAIRDFVEAADQIDTLHSFMLVRHGQVIAEGWWKPEAADKPHILYSLSKSFNSTAVGLAVEDGKLSLDDPVLKFFPADAPAEVSDNLKAMKVRDLLTMTCGHDTEPKAVDGMPSVKQFLAHPVPYAPGAHFQYNTMGSYTLSAIVTKATGQTSLDYLKPRLFEPLGIENPVWDSSTEGNSLGGYGLFLRTEDIAKFGQLYLQKGKWNGKQLIPEHWIAQATSKQVPNDQESHSKIGSDWQQGYGFQFWQCTHHAYRGDGAAGQFCVVLPEQDAVVAITADTGNLQGELNAIWDHLYPAFQAAPLPENPTAQENLEQVIAKLEAHPKPAPLIAEGAKVEVISDGYAFTEGPATDRDGNVFFTDQPNDRIVKYHAADGTFSDWLKPAGRSNGTYFDKEGNLLTCADEKNELWSISPDKKVTVLITDFGGKLLNGPNDLWIRPDGNLYLTDPLYARDYWKRDKAMQQAGQYVFYFDVKSKKLTPVATDLNQPNGIVGTPDGKTLYVADIGGNKTYSYTITPGGALENKTLFCNLGSDGMTIDNEGNLYLTGHGVTVFDKTGKKVLTIPIPEPWTGNIKFGGADRHLLFITASKKVYAVKMRVKGVN